MRKSVVWQRIIPISKLLGNYNSKSRWIQDYGIIPISKLLGNYNAVAEAVEAVPIIPISKLLGNYNRPLDILEKSGLYQYLNC